LKTRWALLIIALLPLLVGGAAMAWLVSNRAEVQTRLHAEAVEPVLLAARKAELQKLVNLARSSIQHLVRDGLPDAERQAEALAILGRLEFGHDGYFFAFDFDGNVLAYPRRSQLVGQNILRRQDRAGDWPVRRLIDQARSGGGYVEVEWERPSTGQPETKLAYVEPIAGWEWVVGSGAYVDEPERVRRRIAESTSDAVADTLTRIGAVTMLLMLGVVALAIAFNVSEQRKADAKLQAMAREIVTSQEAERARVARELHDGVSQLLVSVKFVFESALDRARRTDAKPEVTGMLDQGVRQLRTVLGEVRRISHDLRPALLDDLGLPAALRHLASECATRSGMAVEAFCDEPTKTVPEALATALFRVAQEALGNAEKHARASVVHVRLTFPEGGLQFEVLDNGQGFDIDALMQSPRAGLGLTHMRERIESLGGSFELRSGHDGTRLRAVFAPRVLAA
jgi:two-component system, NarL family, sensor kinase